MTKNGQPFDWCPIHSACFDNIKALTAKTAVLKPIDFNSSEPIWVICDASVSGVRAMYGQGPTWQQCKPAGFMSKKFTSAQQNYRVFELETLAILEALIKWEDKLVGRCIHIVTDHKALEFFLTQCRLLHHQARWMEYLSRFNFDIRYVKGEYNRVADAFSQYYKTDTWTDVHPPSEYVHADTHLDPVRDPVKVRPYWFVPWGSLNAVRKYVSSPTTSTGLYLGRIGIYKVDYKLKNKEIRVRR
jgi:hypothetical protein